MKFINLFALLFAALFFAGCASTESTAPAAGSTEAAPVEAEAGTTATEGLLMDQYKSGEIPGYRD